MSQANDAKAMALIREPFYLNMCRIGGGRLGSALQLPKVWRVSNLDATCVEAIMYLLQENRSIHLVELRELGDPAAAKIADALETFNGAYPNLNLLRSSISPSVAMALKTISKASRVSICGIMPEQTEANLRNAKLGPTDCVLLCADVSFRRYLTSLCLAENDLGPDGAAEVRVPAKPLTSLATVCRTASCFERSLS